MLCISLGKTSIEDISESVKKAEIVEIRLDLNEFSTKEIKIIFKSFPNLIATFRPGKINEEERKNQLITAIKNGAAYVDLEYDAGPDFKRAVLSASGKKGCKIIISYHNYLETPDVEILNKIKKNMLDLGADISKIACLVNSNRDIINILSLLDPEGKTVAIGLGAEGRITRVAGVFMGSPLTYVSADERLTAKGQIEFSEMKKIIDILRKFGREIAV